MINRLLRAINHSALEAFRPKRQLHHTTSLYRPPSSWSFAVIIIGTSSLPRRVFPKPSLNLCMWRVCPRRLLPRPVLAHHAPASPQFLDVGSTPPTSAPSTSTPQRLSTFGRGGYSPNEYSPSEPSTFRYRGSTGLHVANRSLANLGLRWSAGRLSRVEVERTEDGADDVNLSGGVRQLALGVCTRWGSC
jgi:hypothetical protein